MAHSSARCYFLELPTEIRIIIYEKLAPLEREPWFFFGISVPPGRFHDNSKTAKRTAITRVSKQIREEAIPIVYCELQISLDISSTSNRNAVGKWLANVSPAVLQTVRLVTFEPELRTERSSPGVDYIILDRLRDLFEAVVTINYRGKDFYYGNVEVMEIVGGLEIFRNERRIITKAALESLLNLQCED